MTLTHIVVGNEAAKNLEAAKEQFVEEFSGEVLVLKDTLGIGTLVAHDKSSDEVRSQFWQNILGDETIAVDDTARIESLVTNASEDDQVWFWMAPCVSDVAAYYWLLPLFASKPGLLHLVNIAGLPFFNEKGILFTPRNFSEVLPKEIIKCKRLALQLSAADFEVDGEEWARLQGENAQVRTLAGNKRLESKNDNFYDQVLVNQLQFSTEFVKASKVITQAMPKLPDTVSDAFMIYRLKTLVSDGKLQLQGDINKATKDWEVKTA
ncbi:MAG: hypothetical protein RL660_1313 [Bacteroidota bacterium]|jgi:hypothetical protein